MRKIPETSRFHGIINLNKPEGMSSFGAVKRVKGIVGALKAGHAGTLDPLATGVLPICINEATKIVQFLMNEDKEYTAVMTLGVETDTGDREGKVVARGSLPRISEEGLEDVLRSFIGKILQVPPPHCAKKKDGMPLYLLARKGIHVEPEPVEVTIFSIKLIEVELPRVAFHLHCSKGTYVRALVRDIGRRLGCGAHLAGLKRTRCGPFRIEASIQLEHLRERWKAGNMGSAFFSIEETLESWPYMILDDNSLRKIKMGMSLKLQSLPYEVRDGESICLLDKERRMVAISKAIKLQNRSRNLEEKGVLIRPVRIILQ